MNVNKKIADFVINCQFIENNLRLLILICARQIEIALVKQNKTFLHCDVKRENIEKNNMTQLINKLEIFLNDSDLIADLRKLKTYRNNLIHEQVNSLINKSMRKNISDQNLDDYINNSLLAQLDEPLVLTKRLLERIDNVRSKI